MTEREKIDALIESHISRTKKKSLIYGVGLYDVAFPKEIVIEGKLYSHRAHTVRANILQRCYRPQTEQACRTYAGCSVAGEWLRFSNFLVFWKENYREGYHLDKDLLLPGNKIYGPEYCVFVPRALNNFTTDHGSARGQYPQGVNWNKRDKRFQVGINCNGKRKSLGYFSNANEAHAAWCSAKLELAQGWKATCDKIHPGLFDGLMNKVRLMCHCRGLDVV
ncbi:hypothetical protein [Citrobacter sp. C411]|uniref:hypothetical protein n=1 Tax=Citrobacter sp. C411 TaxID=3048144 RepID=UPI0039C05CFF